MPYKNIEDRRAWDRKKYLSRLDGYYSVYYLPEEHYCGATNCVDMRIKDHSRKGKNTKGWRILYCSESRNTAVHYEAMFQTVLGIGGLADMYSHRN